MHITADIQYNEQMPPSERYAALLHISFPDAIDEEFTVFCDRWPSEAEAWNATAIAKDVISRIDENNILVSSVEVNVIHAEIVNVGDDGVHRILYVCPCPDMYDIWS